MGPAGPICLGCSLTRILYPPERRHLPSGSSDCQAQAQHASPPSTQEWSQSEAGEQSEARGEASAAATRTRGTCNDVAASPFQGLPAQEMSSTVGAFCLLCAVGEQKVVWGAIEKFATCTALTVPSKVQAGACPIDESIRNVHAACLHANTLHNANIRDVRLLHSVVLAYHSSVLVR